MKPPAVTPQDQELAYLTHAHAATREQLHKRAAEIRDADLTPVEIPLPSLTQAARAVVQAHAHHCDSCRRLARAFGVG